MHNALFNLASYVFGWRAHASRGRELQGIALDLEAESKTERGGDEKSLAINPHGITDDDGSLAIVGTSSRGVEVGEWLSYRLQETKSATGNWALNMNWNSCHVAYRLLNKSDRQC